MFLLFITLAIKVYVPFWNLLSFTCYVTHFSSAGAQVKHCTLTTFQELHLTTKVWKKHCTYLNKCFSPSVVPMPQCHVRFFTGIHLPRKVSRAFCHTFHIWAYTSLTFKLKVYLSPLWSWDKLYPYQIQACSNFKIKSLTFQKSTITWKVGNSFLVLLLLYLKSLHTTWNIFILEQ